VRLADSLPVLMTPVRKHKAKRLQPIGQVL
jgi:hypothetical protein